MRVVSQGHLVANRGAVYPCGGYIVGTVRSAGPSPVKVTRYGGTQTWAAGPWLRPSGPGGSGRAAAMGSGITPTGRLSARVIRLGAQAQRELPHVLG